MKCQDDSIEIFLPIWYFDDLQNLVYKPLIHWYKCMGGLVCHASTSISQEQSIFMQSIHHDVLARLGHVWKWGALKSYRSYRFPCTSKQLFLNFAPGRFWNCFPWFPLIRVDVNTVDKMKADVKKAVDAAERRHLVRTKTHSGAMMADPERLWVCWVMFFQPVIFRSTQNGLQMGTNFH